MTFQAASLPAHTTGQVRALVRGRRGAALLHELAHAFGGPYHVLLPERFDANAAAFRTAFTEAGVDGRVYFAKKANKAAVFAERAAAVGLGVDVASGGELREALAQGVRGQDLVVTGPAKPDRLLEIAVLQGALVTVDALDELDRVIALAAALDRPARLLLRRLPPAQPDSRFGMDDRELDLALPRCRSAAPLVTVEGFAFHLPGYDVRPRADLAADSVRLCLRARRMGLRCDSVSIGGGFAVDYVPAEDWRRFDPHEPRHYHAGRTFPGFYPYHSPTAGAGALRAILAATPEGEDRTLAELSRSSGVRLLAEPGRALLDQAGFTVFTVRGVKPRDGYAILTVDGTSLSLSEQWFNSEYLPDPVLVRRTPPDDARTGADAPGPGPYPACVGGATCLESDMVTWRKVPFPTPPAAGDLLVYLNTAGYQMDSNESSFHDLPLPPKVVVTTPSVQPVPHGVRWRLDRRP
ncbi:alanine racemase [Sphaerisporangium fuscum]|uniref:alanine racemase n=1 Tax=Sphaerisporangium fuscum TaxID=2835868 RepID=UPI001BDDC744|nr:alanine racemase [Sphaerisporangium fuscum]